MQLGVLAADGAEAAECAQRDSSVYENLFVDTDQMGNESNPADARVGTFQPTMHAQMSFSLNMRYILELIGQHGLMLSVGAM